MLVAINGSIPPKGTGTRQHPCGMRHLCYEHKWRTGERGSVHFRNIRAPRSKSALSRTDIPNVYRNRHAAHPENGTPSHIQCEIPYTFADPVREIPNPNLAAQNLRTCTENRTPHTTKTARKQVPALLAFPPLSL